MSTPMMSGAPPVRAATPPRPESRDGQDGDSAAPFATALDGAMTDGSATSRVTPRNTGRDSAGDAAKHPHGHPDRQGAHGGEDSRTPAGPRAPGARHRHEAAAPADPASGTPDTATPADVPPPAGVPAGLWALLLAAATSAPAAAGTPTNAGRPTATAPAAPLPGVGTVAGADATPALAATLLAAPPAAGPAATLAPPVPATSSAGPTAPGLPAAAPGFPLPLPSTVVAAPAPAAPPALAPAAPAAAFASLAAAAGATVTAVTSTAEPAAPAAGRPAAPATPAADAPDGGVPAAVPLDSPAGAAAPLPVTGGRSAGSGAGGQDGGSPDSSRDGAPGLAGLTPAASTPPLTTAPVSVTAPAAPPAPPAPPVSSQLAQHIAVLRGADDGEHSMTLVLTPERLGPVEVQVTVTKGSLDLSLRGAHEQGRAALLDALPDLRRDLESAGLTCARLEVDRATGGAFTATSDSSAGFPAFGQSASQTSQQQTFQQQTPGQRGNAPDWSDGRFRSGLRTADSGDNDSLPSSTRSTSPGVDVRV